MIEGGWGYIWAAYAFTAAGLGALAVVVALRQRHWAQRARELDKAGRK